MKHFFAALLAVSVLALAGPASAQNGQLSTHILDISQGRPAPGVAVTLYRQDTASDNWTVLSTHATDENGRIADLLPATGNQGVYKLRFETASYFEAQDLTSIYPYIEVVFRLEGDGHYHIPITVSANGYSTYRGS